MPNITDINKSRKVVLYEIGEKLEDKKITDENGILEEAINRKVKWLAGRPVKTSIARSGDFVKAREELNKAIGENKKPAIASDALDAALNRKSKKIESNAAAQPLSRKINQGQTNNTVEKYIDKEIIKTSKLKPAQVEADTPFAFGIKKTGLAKASTQPFEIKEKTGKPIIKVVKKIEKRPAAAATSKRIVSSGKLVKNNLMNSDKEIKTAYYIIIILAALIFYFVFFFFQLSQFGE